MANVLVRPYVLSVSRLLLLRSPRPSSSLSNGSSSAIRGFRKRTDALSNGRLGLGLAGGAPMLRFSIRAAHVNDAGSIDSPLMQSMQNKPLTLGHDLSSFNSQSTFGFHRSRSILMQNRLL
ncbi:hypothetical protein BT93_A2432 [Corymbia citriodora subsp. variegata]|nr:hypothetical protein BT93_A2432 [Corymbia citriodora subsp. variegata]